MPKTLDKQPGVGALAESGIAALPASIDSGLSPDARRILEVIEGLPEDEREVFDLVGLQGLTHAEAATAVEVSENPCSGAWAGPGSCWRNGWPTFARPRPASPRRRATCPHLEEGPPMASDPQVVQLLDEILELGKTPEEVCRNYPELLPEVRQTPGNWNC